MDTIHIVTAANDKYAKPLAVMLTSLLENKKSKNPLTVHVIESNLSSIYKRKLTKCVGRYRATIHFLKINDHLYKNAKVRGHFTKEVYYRISIPSLLDNSIGKAIYLDCDIILKADITRLWRVNIKEYELAAVRDFGRVTWKKALSIPEKAPYFNSGVLIMNLRKWRLNGTSKKVQRYIKLHSAKLRLLDQDALNAVLQGQWLRLNPRWNYQVHRHAYLKFKPALIHYTGLCKPWNGNPYLKKEYNKYLQITPWKSKARH